MTRSTNLSAATQPTRYTFNYLDVGNSWFNLHISATEQHWPRPNQYGEAALERLSRALADIIAATLSAGRVSVELYGDTLHISADRVNPFVTADKTNLLHIMCLHIPGVLYSPWSEGGCGVVPSPTSGHEAEPAHYLWCIYVEPPQAPLPGGGPFSGERRMRRARIAAVWRP